MNLKPPGKNSNSENSGRAPDEITPEEEAVQAQEDFLNNQAAATDALEHMAFLAEIRAIKNGDIEVVDCIYTEQVGEKFMRKQEPGEEF